VPFGPHLLPRDALLLRLEPISQATAALFFTGKS